jgi:hypothetical protein
MVHATLVVEDILQEAAVHRVLASEGIPVSIYRTIGLQGAGFIDANAARLVRASAHGRFIVIRDLDRHHCPPELLRQMFGGSPPQGLLFVVPVREVESWIMADAPSFRRFFSLNKVDDSPEMLDDPKEYLVSLARNSRRRAVREGVVPKGTAKVGGLYNSILLDFIHNHWRVDRARQRSPSLQRFVDRLSVLGTRE